MKLAMSGLSYRLKKKFVGMEFGDLFQLATRVTRYEDILNEEYQCKNSLKRTYYKDPNMEVNLVEVEDCEEGYTTEIGLVEVVAMRLYICRALSSCWKPKRLLNWLKMLNKRLTARKDYFLLILQRPTKFLICFQPTR